MEDKPKRKTRTSNKVNSRYKKKTYKRFEVRFRYDTQQNLIDFLLEKNSISDYISKLVENDYSKK